MVPYLLNCEFPITYGQVGKHRYTKDDSGRFIHLGYILVFLIQVCMSTVLNDIKYTLFYLSLIHTSIHL